MKYLILTLTILFINSATLAVSPITGVGVVCVGSTTTLSDTTYFGVWRTTSPLVHIDSATGVVSGLAAGLAPITYSVGSSSAYMTVTVNPSPLAIAGPALVCSGSSITLTDATVGGVWSSVGGSVSPSGIATGTISSGLMTIAYTLPAGCAAHRSVSVFPVPAPITGSTVVCPGFTTSLACSTTGGTWSSTCTAAATVGTTGVVTGISATSCSGVTTIRYTNYFGCSSTTTVTVGSPGPGTILGGTHVCVGSTITLASTVPGGAWSTIGSSAATIDSSTGEVTGFAPGLLPITYSVSGCSSVVSTTGIITIDPIPAPIAGSTSVCIGSSITVTDPSPGGAWTSGAICFSAGASSGIIGGLSVGTGIVSYTLPTGCMTTTAISVMGTSVGISGPSTVCVGSSILLTASVPGGIWSSGGTISSVSSSGSVLGVSVGTDVISYSVTGSCGPGMATYPVMVTTIPGAITGTTSVCVGSGITLHNAVSGGTWGTSSTNISLGTSSGTGFGLAAGPALVSYSLGTGCIVTASLMVNPLPNVYSVSGGGSYCSGGTGLHVYLSSSDVGTNYLLYNGTGYVGTYSGIGSYLDLGAHVAAGTYTIVGSVTGTGCQQNMSGSATINVIPSLAPSVLVATLPNDTICAGAAAVFMATPVNGGSAPTYQWFLNGVALLGYTANIFSSTALVSGDVVTVVMTTSAPCALAPTATSAPVTMTVISVAPITGTTTVCAGSSIVLSDATAGGTWTSSSTSVASIATIGISAGVVTGGSVGTSMMTYMLYGCISTAVVTVTTGAPITATATYAPCGKTYTLVGGGGVHYSWYPSAGIACDTCGITHTDSTLLATTTYYVTGTDAAGCTSIAPVTVNGNRIMGDIVVTGSGSDTLMVWLIQFNPADSSISAVDSLIACNAGSTYFYEFDGKPAGNYLVKAKILNSVPGTSGYVPTYGLATPHWVYATPISHTTATNEQNIHMIYGTVPAGTGFISGYVYMGAGKGTAGNIPVAGMLVYLKDASGSVLTCTYTDVTGAYSFRGLVNGVYIIYPEDYHYHTSPWTSVVLSPTSAVLSGYNFREYPVARIITPFKGASTAMVEHVSDELAIFPNPSTGMLNIMWDNQPVGDVLIVVTDLAGREVRRLTADGSNVSNPEQIDLGDLKNGLYFIAIKSETLRYSGRLLLQK